MSLRAKWIDLFYRAATGTKGVRTLLTPVGAITFALFIGLFVMLSLLADGFLGFSELFPTPLNIIISLPLLSIGLFLTLWSILHFLKAKGTPVPFNPPPKLVTTGPYACARNPMLTGIFVMLFGLGALLGSISLVFIFTPLFVLFNYIELKSIEEPELSKRLGEEYLEYKKCTPMFIPHFGSDNMGK